MTLIRKLVVTLFPLFFLMLISPVFAPDDVNLLDLPEQLGERLGVSTFAGGLIASAILFMITVLPIAMITRRRNTGFIAELVVGFVVMGVCIAINWLPYWFILIFSMIVALMFAGRMREFITGRG